MIYKWVLNCVIYCFADPMLGDDQNSSQSSDDGYKALEDYVEGRYGANVEDKELAKGVTIAESAEPNYGYNTPVQRKIFEEKVTSEKNEETSAVIAKKLSIWSFFCSCCADDDAVLVTAQTENQLKKEKILADLIGESHNIDVGAETF